MREIPRLRSFEEARFDARDNVTGYGKNPISEKVKECLQGLKPLLLGFRMSELRLRHPKESFSEIEYILASFLL